MSDSIPYRPLPPIRTIPAMAPPTPQSEVSQPAPQEFHLTERQLENWRKYLGLPKHMCSDEEITKYAARIQKAANRAHTKS